MIDELLADLAALVACDTRNPPRDTAASGIFECLRSRLPGFEFELSDHGAGCMSLLARRGDPSLLFNVHVDTVPAAPGWSRDPLALSVDRGRATGLGACDIKGAAACLLSAARRTSEPAAFLFTSDEEAGDSRCVREFCARGLDYRRVVVAEPTRCAAALAHRGYIAATAQLHGRAGHGSEARAREDNALHHAAAFTTELLAIADAQAGDEFAGMSGLRLNVGRINGGIKANMIAADAEVCFGFRPLPTHDANGLLERMRSAIDAQRLAGWQVHFAGPPLPAGDAPRALAKAQRMAQELGLEVGGHVNFWSEAALFSAAGATTLVYGPGDIAQAHSADEWVALAQLENAVASYTRMIGDGS